MSGLVSRVQQSGRRSPRQRDQGRDRFGPAGGGAAKHVEKVGAQLLADYHLTRAQPDALWTYVGHKGEKEDTTMAREAIEGHVVNIDGLLNDDACRYVINNELPAYISQQGIKYILDFEVMLSDRKRRLRGGYDDEAFLQSLQPIRVFGNGGYQWKLLTLYRVLPSRHMDCCVTSTPCIRP